MKVKGYILAAIAAAAYGTNPAFAVPLYDEGINPTSVLIFRYLLSLPLLLMLIVGRGRNILLKRSEILPVAILGMLMAISSLTLFESYRYMNAGVASTLLFMYPVMVAVIMSTMFKERFRITTGICLLIMGLGLIMLMRTGEGNDVNLTGFLLVVVSALTYAIYLVMTHVSKNINNIPTVKLLFYQLLVGSSLFWIIIATGDSFTTPHSASAWANVTALALLPTAISLGCTTMAIQYIGSTPTAIFGSLEPVTAVLLSVLFLDQSLTDNEIFGGILIIISATMVIAADPIDTTILRMRKMFPPFLHKKKPD